MEPHNEKEEEGERLEESMKVSEESKEKSAEMSRKEKRKAMKKSKRKQVRKEIAEKEREEAEAKLNDPAEQEKLKAIEEEEERKREKELREFEESERAWREAMEIKRKKEEEDERRWKELEEERKLLEASEGEDDEYEYIEEGPPEIIFKGNEIILRKNKVRVLKKTVAQVDVNEIADRPTSNPLPPGTEAFPKNQNVSSAQQVLDSVAQEVPNFGTEQDKAHCPFHLKTGACRFGTRCSRVHFYPDKSCTILMKNMYSGPGIAWEQDEGLEYTDEEAEHCYEEFYEDVHTEFLKYGELINFKVNCEFVNISRWKVAICGEYMKSRLKTCSRGSACNFIHCFRNPGGDYEWADYDKPPPRFWIRKMTALFGYSDDDLKHMEREYSGSLSDVRADQPTDSQRQSLRRSRSRDHDRESVVSRPSYRSRTNHSDTRDGSRGHKLSRHEESCRGADGSPSSTRDGSSVERDIYKEPRYAKETPRRESKWSEHSPGHRVMRKTRYSDDDDSGDDNGKGETSYKRKSCRRYRKRGSDSEVQEGLDDDQEESRTHRSSSDRRSRKEDRREGSSADQKENHGHDRVEKPRRERSSSRYSHEGDSSGSRHHQHKGSVNGVSDRKRSVETSPRDKDGDESKQTHRYNKTGDPGSSNRSKKGRQSRESEVNRNGKRENVSGSSSDEERSLESEETHNKERSRSSRHRKRRSHEQTPKEPEEIERWRPM